MAGANEEAAGLLREHAEPIPITGGDSFRARNCPRAASSVAGHADDVTAEAAAAVRKITGTGKSIAGKIIAHPLTRRTGRRPSAGAGPGNCPVPARRPGRCWGSAPSRSGWTRPASTSARPGTPA
ncbi:MAG TPA: helix-hairpin-helix domain-containing protein [Streptosporangiaceae bacterium]|nr:helix-hairpin-helix domain-containing protein [Streptosporangiaceae bacterium]